MHALTVRLPDTTYQAVKRLAAKKGLSINKLIQEAITEKACRSHGPYGYSDAGRP